MKFAEIKHKIKNLGNIKSLTEIKNAGLRICKNSKTGDYWLIEDEFLKHVIKSPRECKSIMVNPENLKHKVLMIHQEREALRNFKVFKYIKWGETKGFQKRQTCATKKRWYSLGENHIFGDNICPYLYNIGHRVYSNENRVYSNNVLYDIDFNESEPIKFYRYTLNSSILSLFLELYGRVNYGEGALSIAAFEVAQLPTVMLSKIKPIDFRKLEKLDKGFLRRSISSVFEELGAKDSKDVSLDKVKSDRRELDKIVMGEILGLNDEEQLEVYRAVIDLVRSRIEKAKSVDRKKKTKEGIDVDKLVSIVLEKIGENTLGKFYKEKILNQEDLITKQLPELKEKSKIEKGLFGWKLVSDKNSLDCGSEIEARYLKIWLDAGTENIKIPKDEKYLAKVTLELERLKLNIDQIIEDYLGSILNYKLKSQILYQIWQKIIKA